MKPILFNTEMVKAILDGKKTATRRIVKAPVLYNGTEPPSRIFRDGDLFQFQWNTGKTIGGFSIKPPYLPGNILYVRETFACDGFDGEEDVYVYRADVDECDRVVWGDIEKKEWAPSSDYHWHPSIHMPKEAARIFLRVTDVRVEQLQKITDEGAKAEGANYGVGIDEKMRRSAIDRFADIWDSTIPRHPNKIKSYPYRWKDNPWVWVISFERISREEAGT